MERILNTKRYKANELSDIENDIQETILEINDQDELDEFGHFKGYLKVTIEYIPTDGCECVGFQHHPDCKNWVMSY